LGVSVFQSRMAGHDELCMLQDPVSAVARAQFAPRILPTYKCPPNISDPKRPTEDRQTPNDNACCVARGLVGPANYIHIVVVQVGTPSTVLSTHRPAHAVDNHGGASRGSRVQTRSSI
jgi:hypothetical protein